MAECEFDRSFSGAAADLIERARTGIERAGGALTGDATQGTFDIATPVGAVAGSYSIDGNRVRFAIVRKPLLVPCVMLEAKVDELLR